MTIRASFDEAHQIYVKAMIFPFILVLRSLNFVTSEDIFVKVVTFKEAYVLCLAKILDTLSCF